jgi:hypothetical protein
MFDKFLQYIGLSCSHANYTFPRTLNRKEGTSVFCLDCGHRFKYDWDRMQIGEETKEIPSHRHKVPELLREVKVK